VESMTREQFENLVTSIDPVNAVYIMANCDILNEYESLSRWERKDPKCIAVLDKDADVEARCSSIANMVRRQLEEKIRRFDGMYLTPANAKVGEGATVNLWSDRHAGTIVKITKSTITVRRDKATLNPDFKPEFIPGGFSVHCTNSDEQTYTYEPDEKGALTTIYWSKKYNRYGTPGNVSASRGRHEHYDYNF
jgi:hypothetical protein